MHTMMTYYAQPTTSGAFTLTSDSGFIGHVKTLKFARFYAEFAGACLIVLDKTGKAKN